MTDNKSALMKLTNSNSTLVKLTDSKLKAIKITDVPAREVAGRDAMSRFNLQFKATTIAALTILDGGDIDRVYCDYQDDFVVREVVSGEHKYIFCQVKTNKKSNHLWSTRQIFGLYKTSKKASVKDISDSFYGKLISHTVNFKDSCKEVRFITNVNFDDSVLN
ncbi:dsDNA nuclease domain-containing protein, partial [Photobacterium sanguinicancri]